MKKRLTLQSFINANPQLSDEAIIEEYQKYIKDILKKHDNNKNKYSLYKEMETKCKRIIKDIKNNKNCYYVSMTLSNDRVKYIKLLSAYVHLDFNNDSEPYLIKVRYRTITVNKTGTVTENPESEWSLEQFTKNYIQDDDIESNYYKAREYLERGKLLFINLNKK